MKKFSKLFWVALVVVAVLACTALGVFAAGVESTAVIYGETVEVAEGENFSVDFNFKFKGNNTKVECGKITLTWDSAKMAAVENGIVPGEALGDAQFGFKIEDGKAVIAWAGSEINAETGTLFTVNFTNKGVAVDGYAGIEVAVDNFGYTNGFFKTELKDTVKANRVFATGSEFANEAIYGNDTTDTLAEFWNKVAGLAEIGNVTVNVEKDMKFDSAITVGPLVNKVTVKSSNGSSLIVNNGVKVTFDGNLEFNNICIYATGNTAGKFDTGFCFPAGAYGTFGENITISGSTPIDISGNATIKSGTYHEVYGNGNLTIEGGTFNSRVFGGYLLTDSTEQTGDVTMTIKGGTFKGAVLGGSLITGGATFSGDVNMTISGVDGTLGNTWGGSLINTAANGKHSGKVTLTVELEKGTVTNLYGGSSISVGTAAQHSGEVDLIVKKGTVTTVYGGSTLYTSKHTGTTNVTIEGGTITTVYGGSNGQGAISHTGASNVTIKGGTISASIYGGSNLVYNNAKQTGKSTLKLIGTEGKTISALSKGGSYIAGGSYSNKSGANHEADSELIIENIYTQSYGGKTKNLTVMVSDVLSNNARYIFGGSLFTGDGKHVGNSSVTIKNSILTDIPTIAGGSCLNTNGTAAAHQGNSSLTIDAENGFGYFQNIRRCTATNFYESGIVAGSIINSWATAPALPKANHTGTSNLYVKAPTEGTSKRINFKEDANAKLYDSFTGKELALDCNLYAGNYYTDNNHLSQQNNSTAEITGSCVLLGYRDWDKMTFVFGGSYYAATKSSVLSTQLRTPSTNKIINKVIIDGCNWLCDAFAGYYWKSTGKTQTMNVDLAIIYKNGGKVGNGNAYVTPMASATGSNGALLLTNNGDVLFEIHTGDADITGQTFKWSPAWQATVNGSKCVKFVEDGTGKFSGTFNLNTKAQYLDISHVSNDVTVKQVDKYNAVIGDGYTYLINNRIAGKNVYFANAGTELPEVGAALAGIKQVEVVPETKFSDLTASPVIIYSSQDNSEHNKIADYALYTKFDALSESPNAFVYYAADKDGNVTGEPLTQVSADPSQKIIVKSGSSYSAPTSLNHIFRMSAANLILESDFSIIVKFKDALTEYYENVTLVGTDKNGNERVISVYSDVVDEMRSFIYKNVSAYTLGDDIQFKLRAEYGKETVETAVTPYSVKRYCDNQLKGLNEKTPLSTLLVDILNYGAAAQQYLYANTDVVLVNAHLTEEQKAFGTEGSVLSDVESVYSQDEFDGATVKWTGATLMPQEKIKIRAKIRPEDMSIDPATLKVGVVVGGGEMTYVSGSSFELISETDGYYVYFDALEPNQLRDTIDLTVYDLNNNPLSNTAHYSVESYVCSKKNDNNQNLVNFCDEMLQYGDSHSAYVNSLIQNG